MPPKPRGLSSLSRASHIFSGTAASTYLLKAGGLSTGLPCALCSFSKRDDQTTIAVALREASINARGLRNRGILKLYLCIYLRREPKRYHIIRRVCNPGEVH